MDVSSRVLSELASRESALDAQIAAAREEAGREVNNAEQEAARILRDAETRVQGMHAEHEQTVATETGRIRDEARAQAGTQAEGTRQRAESKLYDAVETIMRAVLP